jgi:hypothetical protein
MAPRRSKTTGRFLRKIPAKKGSKGSKGKGKKKASTYKGIDMYRGSKKMKKGSKKKRAKKSKKKVKRSKGSKK